MPGLLRAGHQVGLIHEQPFQPALEAIDPSHPHSPPGACRNRVSRPHAFRLRMEGPISCTTKASRMVLWKMRCSTTIGRAVRSRLLRDLRHRKQVPCVPTDPPCERRFGPACLVLHYPRRCGDLHPLRTLRTFQRQMERHSRLPDYQAVL